MQRTIIVLGMHRSGTSALTGCLEEAGVYLGDVVREAPFNAKGNCESWNVMRLQENLLQANGGSWRYPPARVRWRWRHRRGRRAFINSFAGQPIWGFKDPRTLFTLEGWLEVLPDAELAGVFRHPVLCAMSLQNRNKMPLLTGMDLWRQYNERLLHFHGQRGFPIVNFDQDPAGFRAALRRLEQALSLPHPEGEGAFFEEGLRHQKAPAEVEIPPEVLAVHEALQAVAI